MSTGEVTVEPFTGEQIVTEGLVVLRGQDAALAGVAAMVMAHITTPSSSSFFNLESNERRCTRRAIRVDIGL